MEIKLLIDSTNPTLLIGIAKDNNLIYSYVNNSYRTHSEQLGYQIDKAFKETNIDPKSVNKIILTNGPGSYTGIRIALSFAKVFALSINIDHLYLISSLKSLVNSSELTNTIIPLRNKQYFYGQYENYNLIKEDIVDETFINSLDKNITIYLDDNVDILNNMIKISNIIQPTKLDNVDANYVKKEFL